MIFVSLNKKLNKKVLLLILDGWGIADNKDASAPDKANTPNFNSLIENYPNNFLITHGEKVGLPKGQMGNSEVCLLYTSPSPRDRYGSRMPSSA